MAEPSEETRQNIKGMTTEQLHEEVNLGNKSHFQGAKFDCLKTEHELRLAQNDDQHKQKTIEESKKSNSIASQALATSRKSFWLAVVAVIVSIAVPIVQYYGGRCG